MVGSRGALSKMLVKEVSRMDRVNQTYVGINLTGCGGRIVEVVVDGVHKVHHISESRLRQLGSPSEFGSVGIAIGHGVEKRLWDLSLKIIEGESFLVAPSLSISHASGHGERLSGRVGGRRKFWVVCWKSCWLGRVNWKKSILIYTCTRFNRSAAQKLLAAFDVCHAMMQSPSLSLCWILAMEGSTGVIDRRLSLSK